MAGSASEEGGGGQSVEALAEWRSSEQVENGTPSTSPPFWDTDDDDECGPKPSELYGKYTWKIDKFSQINKRELRSNAFEVGGYKWYILIYPQGCDVCNHLSLFLCVANHDKLLPGWSHFAQFTIAVVNKDPKKSKYSDTLHRFWKKEHDWGWKKFMELSKVVDGFIDADTLIIKAQVQVIRERADRPFRCLDCQYRRELVRVYLTNVEQICRRFVEERRSKLGKLIEDKARWSSFCGFWLGIDQNSRRRMSREKTDSILKVVAKHFFLEKEVTSTLVMDALYSGLKALEGQIKLRKARAKYMDAEALPIPIVRIEKETFLLVDDVLLLLERAAMEPLPPKDDKGPQNRTKDGGSGEDFTKDSIERDERRLTELGRRTIEIFVLDHIFSSKIEVAYQEAVALKRQEELIREEEAAWLAESEQKAKRGTGEKKSKKKQGKQKRNNRKVKDRVIDENLGVAVEIKSEQEILSNAQKDTLIEDAVPVFEKPDTPEDVSDVSDLVDSVPEILQPDSEDRESSIVNWDTDTSEVHPPTEASSSATSGLSSVQNGEKKISSSVMDDSSSTCSTDSLPSVVMNGPNKGSPLPNQKIQKSPSRGRSQRGRVSSDASGWANDARRQPSEALSGPGLATDVSGSCKVAEVESEAVVISLQDRVTWLEHHVVKKEEEVSLQRKLTVKDDVPIMERPLKEKATEVASSPRKNQPSPVQPKSESKTNVATGPIMVNKQSLNSPQWGGKAASPITSAETTLTSKPHAQKADTPKPTEKSTSEQVSVTIEKPTVNVMLEKATVDVTLEKPTTQQVPVMSRPLSAPLIPGPRPVLPSVSMVQTAPLLSRSVSAAGRLGLDPSSTTHSYIPQSYRNVMMGNPVSACSASFSQPHSPNSAVSSVNSTHAYSQSPLLISAPSYIPQSPDRMEQNSIRPDISFGMVNQDMLQSGSQWVDCDPSSSLHNDFQNIDLYNHVDSRLRAHFPTDFPASISGRQVHGVMADEFPHLDIINDLLDDEHGPGFQNFSNEAQHLTRQFTFPGDMSASGEVGPSTSTCGFERTRSYREDEFRHDYMYPQANLMPYANGQIDGMILNEWQMGGSDLSYLCLRNTESDGYPYHIPEYTNLACGVNGYTVFRPSNGH